MSLPKVTVLDPGNLILIILHQKIKINFHQNMDYQRGDSLAALLLLVGYFNFQDYFLRRSIAGA